MNPRFLPLRQWELQYQLSVKLHATICGMTGQVNSDMTCDCLAKITSILPPGFVVAMSGASHNREFTVMPSVIIQPPKMADDQLLFDESETRQILKFFWPHRSVTIDPLSIADDARRFAQTLLIMAIDASYAMGYVEQLFRTVANPRGGLKAMGKKLAKRYSQHWFKHARQSDLEDVRIYDSVRSRIAVSYRSEMELLIADQAAAMQPRRAPLQIALSRSAAVWS